ncbi:MAG: deoxyribodipyrimidine photo-lyase [Planctomycetota bacterium]|nr:deoxyribodipyrimidine photo-lyase [Planctomycetota bacterium]
MASPAIVWFRQDLRLRDNPALIRAATLSRPVVAVFIWSPEEEGEWMQGAARRWWTHQALKALDEALKAKGSRLIIRSGPALETLRGLARETGASAVFWNRRWEPVAIARDTFVKEMLRIDGLDVESFNGSLLKEPPGVLNKQGKPFQVFTPMWKATFDDWHPEQPWPAPRSLKAPATWPASEPLESLKLEPKIPWDQTMRLQWRHGEDEALAMAERFGKQSSRNYLDGRNIPGAEGTSRLSPYLASGEISPRQAWHTVLEAAGIKPGAEMPPGMVQFLKELGWREFGYQLLYHFPHTPTRPLRADYERFPWDTDKKALHAWQKGLTGFPIVDAGMRQLWATGWMHNRVRMIVASFLVKDLLITWLEGARWFWDTLVDGDLASNTMGWQWAGGCGADAAPYFRVFNPMGQGERFDPGGDYVRHFVPELAALPDAWIQRPWEAPPLILAAARVTLGTTYPRPIVDHSAARTRALAALATIRRE